MTDRDLLRRFLQDADESTFAEIVRRHQQLVIGVCRRVIGNDADVDDAFQATFVTLARQPRSIRNANSLGSWLYTVAWRASWRLVKHRRNNPVQPLISHPLHEPPDPLERIASEQDCMVLDEELNDLPTKYREVLVLTYFADRSSQQIADELSVSKGTVDGRIRQARNLLRVRLARRGVAIGALAVATGMCSGASAAASSTSLAATIQLGVQTLGGSLPGTTDLSHLEPLIRPETAMISSKLIASGALCVSAVLGIFGIAGLTSSGQEGNSQTPVGNVTTIDAQTSTSAEAKAAVTGQSTNEQPADIAQIVAPVTVTAEAAAEDEARLEPDPAEYSPQDKLILQALEQPISRLAFAGETSLAEVLGAIRVQLADISPTVALRFDTDLRLRGIPSPERIVIRDIDFDGMTIRNALKLILHQTHNINSSPIPLDFMIRNEMLVVTDARTTRGEQWFEAYADEARPVEKWMHHVLDMPVQKLDFPGDTPLSEVLETIETDISGRYGDDELKLTMLPDHGELSLEGMDSLEDITVSDIFFDGMTLKNVLQHIFDQTKDDTKAAAQLTYTIRNEVMLITTANRIHSEDLVNTRVYPVAHLLAASQDLTNLARPGKARNQSPVGNGFMSIPQFGTQESLGGGGGSSNNNKRRNSKKPDTTETDPRRALVRLVVDMTMNSDGDNWNETAGGFGSYGSIDLFGNNLVVRQTAPVHKEIVTLLNLLTKAR